MTNGLFYPFILDESICHFRGVWWKFSFFVHFLKKFCKQTV